MAKIKYLFLLALLTSCTAVDITSVTITPSKPAIELSKELKLTAKVTSNDELVDKDKEVKWKSSDTDVASVDQDGLVTTKRTGSVEIIAISKANDTKIGKVQVTIFEKSLSYMEIEIESETKTVEVGENRQLIATVHGSNLQKEDKQVTWQSSNPTVASINQNGLLTGKKSGMAKITATSKFDSDETAKMQITVIDRSIAFITIELASSQLEVGQSTQLSAIRHESRAVIGITIRIGRFVTGAANELKSLLNDQESLMLIGPPNVGKTTVLRDITRILAEKYGPKVIVVDTNSEIAGGGKIPVAAIGYARRMHVPEVKQQGNILMQALANHGAKVIVADEIGFHDDVIVATTIACRGVKLIATVHGNNLEDVIGNPDLRPLLGGFNPAMTQRLGKPVFGKAIEIPFRSTFKLHVDLGKAIDRLLAA